MKFLQQEKPDVYDYVVTTWNRRNETEPLEEDYRETNFGESATSASKSQSIGAKTEKVFDEVKVAEGESNEAGETQ